MNSKNAETANNGVDVYTTMLYLLADEYIETKLDGKEDDVAKYFRDMIFFMRERIEKPDNSNIEALDKLFEAYVRICTRYGKLPTLECFSWLCGINRSTFTDWKNKEYRLSSAHSNTVQKWFDICRGFAVDELSNSRFANPNLIFISKASYGLRETAPLPVQNPHQIASRTPEEIAAGYGMAVDGKRGLPEIPE